MTGHGLESIKHHIDGKLKTKANDVKLKKFIMPDDIMEELKSNPVVLRNFEKFPESYKRIRIGWIDASRRRPELFRRRLNYFIKMTAKNKKFGMVQ